MFISNNEKFYLLDKVKLLDALIKEMSLMATEITMLKAKVKVLEGVKSVPKIKLTTAQKEKRRSYSRAYYARKKAERLAKKTS